MTDSLCYRNNHVDTSSRNRTTDGSMVGRISGKNLPYRGTLYTLVHSVRSFCCSQNIQPGMWQRILETCQDPNTSLQHPRCVYSYENRDHLKIKWKKRINAKNNCYLITIIIIAMLVIVMMTTMTLIMLMLMIMLIMLLLITLMLITVTVMMMLTLMMVMVMIIMTMLILLILMLMMMITQQFIIRSVLKE